MENTYFRIINSAGELQIISHISAEFNGHSFSYSKNEIDEYSKKLDEPNHFLMIACDSENIPLGFIAASEIIFPNSLFISELLIDQKAQGKGIGRELIKKVLDFARSAGLSGVYTETETWNTPAQRFYEACKMTPVENANFEGVTYYVGL